MSRFTYTKLPLDSLILVERKKLSDERGFLSRLFCSEELRTVGWSDGIAQINHTLTVKKGAVRGMHFQRQPFSEKKLVSCVKGEVWDVAVDLRKDSPTFLKWHAEILSYDNCKALLIPEGFAHGFQTLCDNCELVYLHSVSHAPDFEGGIRFNDPILNINWPCPITDYSSRDISHELINKGFKGV